MTCYDNLSVLRSYVPNHWEPDPRLAFVSLVYNGARPRNSKTKNSRKDKEGGVGGKLSFAEKVTLKPSEHSKLVAQYGEVNTRRAIAKLSAYKVSKDKRYKSDYGAILNWVMAAVLGTKSAAVPEPVRQGECPECHIRGGAHGAFCKIGNGEVDDEC